jgi:hypothetical protein
MLLVLIFGCIAYTISANLQTTIVLRTPREIINSTNFNSVDSSPTEVG